MIVKCSSRCSSVDVDQFGSNHDKSSSPVVCFCVVDFFLASLFFSLPLRFAVFLSFSLSQGEACSIRGKEGLEGNSQQVVSEPRFRDLVFCYAQGSETWA